MRLLTLAAAAVLALTGCASTPSARAVGPGAAVLVVDNQYSRDVVVYAGSLAVGTAPRFSTARFRFPSSGEYIKWRVCTSRQSDCAPVTGGIEAGRADHYLVIVNTLSPLFMWE